MGDLYLLIILGHFVGDYLLQPLWMAIVKSENSIMGYTTCTLHCLIYTLAVTAISGTIALPEVWLLVFFSHFFIDKWSLAQSWLNLIGGRNVMKDAEVGNMVGVAFSAVVYTVTDNILHILIMIMGLNLIL